MEKVISENFGCRIIERDNKIFIRYDSGTSASKMVENEITAEDAKKAMLSEKDAYEVILKAQQKE